MMTVLTEFGVENRIEAQMVRIISKAERFHCVIRSRAGTGSGHRIVKWFTVSRQC
jgi:hypothetical protein